MSGATTFSNLHTLAAHLRQELESKKFILLYGYNGTGKTRLSTAFTDLGKVVNAEGETEQRDTLYFNAFTEDLFTWDNDLENDEHRTLELNTASNFFIGLNELENKTFIQHNTPTTERAIHGCPRLQCPRQSLEQRVMGI